MKLLILGCVLCAIMTCGMSLDWDVEKTGQKCLMVHWNVNQMLLSDESSTGSQNQTLNAETGTVDQVNSVCGGSLGTLIVKISTATLTLTFTPSNDGLVKMDGTLQFKPDDFFRNGDVQETSLAIDGDLPLSNVNKSYHCVGSSTYQFSGPSGNNTYRLFMNVNNVTIQAFNVANGDFSEETECSLDQVTTEGPVTEPPTTQPPTEQPTTEAPTHSNAATTQPGTSVPPAPAAPKYVYSNCVIVQGTFKLDIAFTNTNNQTSTKTLSVPENAKVEGQCPDTNQNSSALELSWTDNGAKRMIMFRFTATADAAELAQIDVEVDLDNTTFPDTNKPNVTVQHPVTDVPLFEPSGYMTCKAPQDLALGEGLLLKSENVAVQAFHLNGSDFTGKAQPCEADQTTVLPLTTVPPTAPPASTPPVNTYVVGDTKCIVFKAGIKFQIPYTKTDASKATAIVSVPKNITSTGDCGNVSQTLTIMFYEDWMVSLIFSNGEDPKLLAASNKFFLHNISLTYILTDQFFPNANKTGEQMSIMSRLSSDAFEGTVGESYQCSKEQTLDLDDDIKMDTYDLQYKAFSSDNSTGFGSEYTECPGDSSTNSVVPIAVGAALAALVIIVLIAYLIGRKRSRTGYEQV